MIGRVTCLALAAWALLLTVVTHAQIDVASPLNKHNLSVTGPGPVKATTETEICVFCHAPHNVNPAVPLWNHSMTSGVTYQPYTSTTLNATVGLPSGSSKLCLSCHDGTIAIGSTMNNGLKTMAGVNASGQLTGASIIGPDLRNDHPVSFVPTVATDIVAPPAGSPVKLDANGQVQCRTCHDPHRMDIDSTTRKFLVVNNSGSGLCIVCHNTQYWSTNPSTHKTSTKSFAAAQGAHTGYTTVATNGCESCHKPHAAASGPRNIVGVEEAACTSCHGTNAIGRNIAAEFNKTYRHPTYSVTPSAHDASESPSNATRTLPETSAAAARHAECADCHNPHASYAATTAAPKGSGKIAGVWGIDSNGAIRQPSGTPASVNEYEICYKCHADSANKPQPVGPTPPYPNRVVLQFNKRVQFDPGNLSYHPIESAGRNATVPSLMAPWTVNSIVTCTDCHDNDTGPKAPTPGTGPAGPHGSQYSHLLVANYNADIDPATESATAYALCYKCHDRTKLQGGSGLFASHGNHVTLHQASCSVCHDPHGVTNNTNLVNFDRRFVTASNGVLTWTPGSNGCTLTCHGAVHPRP